MYKSEGGGVAYLPFAQNNYNKMTRKVWAYKAVQSQGIQLIINFMMLFTYFGLKRFYLGNFG